MIHKLLVHGIDIYCFWSLSITNFRDVQEFETSNWYCHLILWRHQSRCRKIIESSFSCSYSPTTIRKVFSKTTTLWIVFLKTTTLWRSCHNQVGFLKGYHAALNQKLTLILSWCVCYVSYTNENVQLLIFVNLCSCILSCVLCRKLKIRKCSWMLKVKCSGML